MSSSPSPDPVQVDVEALYLRYRGLMRRTAQVQLGARGHHLVDDVIAEVVAELVRAHGAGTLTTPDSWEAYLIVAVRRCAQRLGGNAARRAAREVHLDKADESDEPNTAVTDERASDNTERTADVLTLDQALDKLPEQQRLLIVQRFWLGATLTQLAPQYGVTPQALSQRLQHALATLREEWDDDDRPQ